LGTVLDVSGAKKDAGTKVHMWEKNGTAAQVWKVVSSVKWFHIVPYALNDDLVLDCVGDKQGAQAVVALKRSGGGQLFRVVHGADGWSTLVSNVQKDAKTNLVLDVYGGKKDKGTPVHLWEPNGTAAQKWKVLENGGIESSLGTFLDVNGGKKDAGTKVHMWESNGSPAQKWKLVPAPQWYYLVPHALNADLALECVGDKQGSKAFVTTKKGSAGQLFRIVSADQKEGWVTIECQAQHDGKHLVLDVAGGNKEQGADIHLYSPNGTAAQKWKLQNDGEIESALGTYLDVNGGKKESGTKVHMWKHNGSPAQKWQLVLF